MRTRNLFKKGSMILFFLVTHFILAQTNPTPPPPSCPETTWNGSSWDNGFPDATKTAIFNGNYSSTGNITCCSVYVYAGKNVVFNSNHVLKSTNEVTIEATGKLVFENNASLVQVNNDFTNIGTIQYHVQTQPMNKNDFNYFCSPVSGQVLNQLGVNSFAAPGFIAPNKYYYWNNSLPAAGSNIPHYYYGNWNSVPATSTMNPAGRGFIINGPQSFDPIVRQPWDVVFEGLPNNGTISLPIQGQTYVPCQDRRVINTIGNPYPSPLDADSFLTENNAILGGALYFYTHNTFYNGSTYTANDFAVYNLLGGIGTGNFNSSILNSNRPNGKISVGQGFQVMGESNGNIVFTNDMRDESTNTIFYRNSSTVNPLIKHRIWLSIEENTPIGAPKYKETLVGYINNSGVTNGYEKSFDNVQLDNLTPPLNLYSVINSSSPCPKLAIQTRAL
jgi:hypothetical protein